jgi:hypothetical protein
MWYPAKPSEEQGLNGTHIPRRLLAHRNVRKLDDIPKQRQWGKIEVLTPFRINLGENVEIL